MTDKPKVGFFGITGCAGCLLSVVFNEEEIAYLAGLVDIKAFPFIKEDNSGGEFDIVFMEGLVASNDDLEVLRKIRGRTKKIVALGACAHTGCIPAFRNFTLKENYKHLLYEKAENIKDLDPAPISDHVAVDYTIPGCPPNKGEILRFVKDICLGKEPRMCIDPVCVECRRNRNGCLLDDGRMCMGIVTRGGCDAVCVNGGFECWGCRSRTEDANVKELIDLLREKGFGDQSIKDRMRSFVGTKLKKIEEEFK